ncbi:hypothetical protein [Acidovorax sp. LjRoot117]|uniref:hypothetical protein n=1 Tax=Acidovorax sp. LjRoot117 TaxID=3342255 RepID=UPI003ED1482B
MSPTKPFTLVYAPTTMIQIGKIGLAFQSAWNGMEEWRDSKGRKVIVVRENNVFSRMFGGLLGEQGQPSKLEVVGGDIDLMKELLAEVMPMKAEGEA